MSVDQQNASAAVIISELRTAKPQNTIKAFVDLGSKRMEFTFEDQFEKE